MATPLDISKMSAQYRVGFRDGKAGEPNRIEAGTAPVAITVQAAFDYNRGYRDGVEERRNV